jgi:hypothetical protein
LRTAEVGWVDPEPLGGKTGRRWVVLSVPRMLGDAVGRSG